MKEKQKEMPQVAKRFDSVHYHLKMFVTGKTVRSEQAITNLKTLCEEQ